MTGAPRSTPTPAGIPPRDAPVEAVVFDLFDTLVDLHFDRLPLVELAGRAVPSTYGDLHAALPGEARIGLDDFVAALLGIDRDWAAGAMAEGIELPTRERFRRLAERIGLAHVAGLPERLTAVHMGRLRSVAEVPAAHAGVLARLRDRYRIGLCSNFSHADTALGILDEAGLLPLFDAVSISETVGLRKPRPEIFADVLARLGVEPSRAVHVGDHPREDVAGATGCGLRTAWATRRVRDAALLDAANDPAPTWRIADLAELHDLLPGS